MLEINTLGKHFSNKPVLHDISFSIPDHSIWGIVGPNGAGKTTLFKCLSGLLKPDQGECHLDNIALDFKESSQFSRIGCLLEGNPLPFHFTVSEYLNFRYQIKSMPRQRPKWTPQDVVEVFSLHSVQHMPIAELSQGFQRRVGLAECLIGQPELLLLDEPSNGLDPHQIMELRHILAELKTSTTILLSSHYLTELEVICDGLIFLNNGMIKESGTKSQLLGKFDMNTVIEFAYSATPSELESHLQGTFGSALSKTDHTFTLQPDSNHTIETCLDILNRPIHLPQVYLKHLHVKRLSLEDLYRRIMDV